MIGYIVVFIAYSLLMIVLGIHIVGKDCENRIENLKRNRDFHKDQREMFAKQSKTLFEENKNLKERNLQLINENKGGNKMSNLKFKEGQTYVCVESDIQWWTEGSEYTVVCNTHGKPVLIDDEDDEWTSNALSNFNNQFKLKEDTTSKALLRRRYHN